MSGRAPYSPGPMLMPLVAFALAAESAPGIAGDWLNEDRSAVVRIGPCGAALCGRIVRVLAAGAPATDIRNPVRALRARPLVGLTVLSGFSASGAGGRAYNPRSGHSYRATLRRNPNGTLRVTGCVAVICRSQIWTRRR
jgi:uncharacterized protein (DUF2147 family)